MTGKRFQSQRLSLPWLSILIFAVGLLLRVWQFGAAPGGLNQDEASIGYEAWSILHDGIDRNGIHWPVHLISWGSGQNALYAYLSMPFIALLGLNPLSVRMVNLLFGLLGIWLVYLILNRVAEKRCAYIGMALMAIAPWSVMVSRWGLESNLFPNLFLLAFYVLLEGLERPRLLPCAAALLALSLYSYGAAYFIVPLFCVGVLIYLIRYARVPIRYYVMSVGVFLVVATPIALFVLTNLFHWGDIKLLGFTAPEMTGVSRMLTATEDHAFASSVRYFMDNVILQKDGMLSNHIDGYGTLYPLSLPFAAAGIGVAIARFRKKRQPLYFLLLVWLLSAVLLFFVYAWTNINRVNILFPALILLTAVGLDWMCGDWKKLSAVGCCYLVMLAGFVHQYFGNYQQSISKAFFSSFGEAVTEAAGRAEEGETIYLTNQVSAPYIYALFYTQTPPAEYIKTAQIPDLDQEFQNVTAFGSFVFHTDSIEDSAPGVYVLPNQEAEQYKETAEQLAAFERYTVLRIHDNRR